VSISVGSNAASYLSYAGNAYGAGNTASKASPASTDTTDTSSPSSATSVTLSDEAKAYMARTAAEADGEQPSVATLATRARAWFDQQYVALGTSSAMLDGQVAVDFSGQTRATLSVIADNAQGQFSTDEGTAATRTMQSRFQDAASPHAVFAQRPAHYDTHTDAAY